MGSEEGFYRLAAFATRRPLVVLGLALAGVLLSFGLAVRGLELRTSNLDLINPELPEVRRFREFAETFGTPNALVVVLEGADADTLRGAVDRLGPHLATLPGVRAVVDRLPFPPEAAEILGIDPYLSSHDEGLFFLLVVPEDPTSSAATLAPFVAGVRRELATMSLDAAGIHAGLTGMPAYALDDREIIERDTSRLSLLSLVLVLGLFVTAFGAWRRPLLAVVTLAVGVGLVVGTIVIYPGHLTLLSAFFAAILFGIGIDYGIHVIDRVEEEVAEGESEHEAVPRAVAALARGLVTSALTTATVLFAMLGSGFRGFEELGTIAGLGILTCLGVTLTVLPALLALFHAPPRRERRLSERRVGRVLTAMQHPVAAALLTLLAVAGAVAGGPGFDTDYLNLQPAHSEAARLEREMVRRSDWSPEFAAFTVGDRDELKQLLWLLADDETVGRVRSLRDLEIGGVLPELDDAVLSGLRTGDGRYAVYAYPEGNVWDPEVQARFIEHMRAIDPEVTGMPFLGSFMVERSRRALHITATLGAVLLLFWMLVDFRRLDLALLAVLPAYLTAGALFGLMRLLDLSFNPLNVMALPVVLGIAVDDGVHIVHRYVAERGDLSRVLAGTGRSVMLTSATTLSAFASLTLTSHRGLASFALAMCLGVAAALVLSVVVLPQLLRLVDRRTGFGAGARRGLTT